MFKEFLQKEGLSVERLHTLVQLSVAGSLTQAAGGDSGKQTRMSHHLRELGEFFGAPLTERSGKTLRLTSKGAELASLARSHLSALQTFQRSVVGFDQEWSIGAGDSLLQWLLIPAVGRGKIRRFLMHNLQTAQVAAQVQDERLDFGLIRSNAVRDSDAAAEVAVVKYAIVVPRRMLRRNITTAIALTELPHAAVASEGQLTERLRSIAGNLGGYYRPHLRCDSIGQCLAAVKTGTYAAVLPTHIIDDEAAGSFEIVEADLDELKRPVSLIWNRRVLETIGAPAAKTRDELLLSLRDEAERRGLTPQKGE